MFNVNKLMKDSNLPKTKLYQLQMEVRKDYPNDSLLYELHMIRALKANARKMGSSDRLIVSR